MYIVDVYLDNIDLLQWRMCGSFPARAAKILLTSCQEGAAFYLELSPDKNCKFAVVCGGREECTGDFIIDRCTFPYMSIEFVSRGRGTLWLKGQEYPLAAGSVFTYGPDIAHKIVADQADPFSKYFVDFLGSGARRFMEENGLQLGTVRKVSLPLELERSLDDLISHGLRESGAGSKLCDTLMRYVLLLVASSSSPATTSLSLAHSTYLRCREQIEKQYLSLQSLDEVAKVSYVDKAYLCRLFQRFDHQSPYQYMTRLKMNRAAALLEESNLLVKQIAATVGYADAFHFSRCFRSVFGMSPRQFRELRTKR